MLDPGCGRTKTARLWAYARDDRPWGGSDRRRSPMSMRPTARRRSRSLILPASRGSSGRRLRWLSRPCLKGEVSLEFCWSHVRRWFYELAVGGASPIPSEALQRIAALYRNENHIRDRAPDERRDVRRAGTRPLIADLEPWLREKSVSSARRANSPRRSAMRSRAGRASPASSTMARSRLTPIQSNAQSDPSLLSCRPGAGPAIRRQMGLPGLDMVFGLAAPAIDILVEPASVAFAQIGDDEAGVPSFRARFDASDDPLDPAPALRAVEELHETTKLAISRRGPRISPSCWLRDLRHGGAMSWLARRRGCNRGHWRAPIENLGTAIVAVGPRAKISVLGQ